MNKIKKKLKSELERRVPQMSEKLINYPITTSNEVTNKKKFKWYHWLSTATLGIAAAIILIICLIKPKGTNPIAPISKCNLYMLEVNPTIFFTVDEDNNVIDLKSGNVDADSVLVSIDTLSLIGNPIDNALEIVTEELLEMGYFNSQSQNAVKLSTVDSTYQEQTELIGSKLSSLFCQKGYFVAVVQEEIDVKEFNQKYNINLESSSNLLEYFNELEDFNYKNKKLTTDEIKTEYKNNYLNDYLFDLLSSELDNIESSKKIIIEIYDIYSEILNSDDIKFQVKDYFLLDKINLDFINSSIKDKIKRIEELLAEYEKLTGNEITSSIELLALKSKLELISVSEIKAKLQDLNSFINDNEFDLWIENIIEILDLDEKYNLNSIIKAPESLEELDIKITIINNKINENKKEKFKNEFNKSKEKITEEQYKTYIDSIIEEHGSLSDFWKKKK